MRTYAQCRTIARAAEIRAEPATLLGLPSRLLGSTTFIELAGGVPGWAAS